MAKLEMKSKSAMTSRHWFVLVIVGIVFYALVLEVVGNLFYLLLHGEVFYRHARSNEQAIDPFGSGYFRPVIHPYFGFVYTARPDAGVRHLLANNHLFLQERNYVERHPGCCDFPVRTRDPDELIIGFTGGSVSAATAYNAQADDYLPRILQKIPAFAGRRIRVLSFASGGHKQPQQLLVLAYYLSLGQKFDAVINIDGFNDVVYGMANPLNNVAVSFPIYNQWQPWTAFIDRQAAYPNSAGRLFAYHELAAREWTMSAEGCRFAGCYLIYRTFGAWHALAARWSRPSTRGKAESYFAIYPKEPGDALGLAVDQWASSVEEMSRLLKSYDIPFLTIVQPNQWFRAKTSYTPHTTDQGLARGVPPAYRAILARVPELQARGVPIIDATGLFDDYGNEMYSDDCCHFSTAGYQILLNELVKWMDVHKLSAPRRVPDQ
jgi:hypothetical protein